MTLKRTLGLTVIAAMLLAPLFMWDVHAAPTPVQIHPPTGAGGPVRIAVLADHFTSGEQDDFNAAAQNFIQHSLLNDPYYRAHASAFTVKTLFEAWTSGAAPSNYGFELGVGSSSCSIHWATNTTSLVDAVVRPAMNPVLTVIIGNYDYNFGCSQDTWSYIAVGSLGNRVIEHELGHSIGGLDDEFSLPDQLTTPYPSTKDSGNCSTLTPPQWANVPSSGSIPECDLFGVGISHAFQQCRMRVPDQAFCAVCNAQMDGAFAEFTPANPAPTDLPVVGAAFFSFQPPPPPPPAAGRSVAVLVRVNDQTGKTTVLSTTEVPGPAVGHYRRLGDYVYEIREQDRTVASSVIAGNPFSTHSYRGMAAPHASPVAHEVAINVTIPDISKAALASGLRAPEIIFYKLGRAGTGPITPQRLADLKSSSIAREIARVPYSALKFSANGGVPPSP
jgi:hypothetical protein